MVFPNSLAKLYVEQAGQQYEPSNGMEGSVFHEESAVGASATRK